MITPLSATLTRSETLMAADAPSSSQKEAACKALLREAKGAIDALQDMLDYLREDPDNLAQTMADPMNRAVVQDRISEALIKIDTVVSQCGDVLPAADMETARELQRRGRDVERQLLPENKSNFDARAFVDALSKFAAGAAAFLGGVLGFLLQRAFQREPAF